MTAVWVAGVGLVTAVTCFVQEIVLKYSGTIIRLAKYMHRHVVNIVVGITM